jgi:uncharacterized protein (DUF1330 family)
VKLVTPPTLILRGDYKMKVQYAIGLAMISAIAGAVVGLVHGIHAAQKPKAYSVLEIGVTNSEMLKPYLDGIAAIVPPAGGRFLALSNKALALSGAPPKPLIAIVEWHSLDEARAFFFSDDYVNLIPSREAGSNFRAFVVEGRQ